MDLKLKSKQEYIQNGKFFFEEHCNTSRGRPLFFPDIEISRKSGKLVAGGVPAIHKEPEADSCNLDVYRAMKCLKQPVIILHKLIYSHNQFHMWQPTYNPEACAKQQTIPNCSLEHRSSVVGYHDFLLFGPDYVVIIDVYAPVTDEEVEKLRTSKPKLTSHQVLERLEEQCRSQLELKLTRQRRSLELIERIAKTVQSETETASKATTAFKLFRYIAFPNKDENCGIFIFNEMSDKGEKIGVMKEKDLADIQSWWVENINGSNIDQCETIRGDVNGVQHVLFAIWSALDQDDGQKSELEMNRPTFYVDRDNVDALVSEMPEEVPMHSILQLLKGPLLGYSEVVKVKSEIGKSVSSSIFDTEQLDLQSIIKDILFEKTQFISLLETFANVRSLTTNEKLTNKEAYFKRGKKLFEAFSLKSDDYARMFPTCPNHKYVDLHKSPVESEEQRNRAENDKQKQQDYEAEVKVYRALEKLKGQHIVVIHSLKYTHYQYRMWDSNHSAKECSKRKEQPTCKKGLNSDEGENDFVVIGPDYIVLIEVKNAEEKASQESMSDFAKAAVEQMDKLQHVIRGIAKESIEKETVQSESETQRDNKITPFKVFRFVAFPGINSNLPGSKSVNYAKESLPMKLKCIFSSDLGDLAVWWQTNVTGNFDSSVEDVHGDLEKVKHVLWTLWATEGSNFDGSSVGLQSDLIETDRRLRESEITMVSKNSKRALSSNVERTEHLVSASVRGINIFSSILGITHITKNQQEAFEKDSANLVITGCTGSGKSLILIARFIRQALLSNSELKMILLVFNQLKLVEYKRIFQKAHIGFMEGSEDEFDLKLWQSRIGIIHCNTQNKNAKLVKLLSELTNLVTYVDDAHACAIDLSSMQCACIAVDFNQCHLPYDQSKPLWSNQRWSHFDLVTLTNNYRSTWNIVTNLQNLSQVIRAKEVLQKNFAEYPPQLSHDPSHGHLIYGPQTDIDVIHNSFQTNRKKQLTEVLRVYFNRIPHFFAKFRRKDFTRKCFIIDPNEHTFYKQLAQQLNDFGDSLFCVTVNAHEQNIYSTEFATCFICVVFSNIDTKMLRSLYNVISRARAYCHIIVMTDEKTDKEQLVEFLDIFKEAKVNHIEPSKDSKIKQNRPSDATSDGVSAIKYRMLDIDLD